MTPRKNTKACGGRLAYKSLGGCVRVYTTAANGHRRYEAKCLKCDDNTTNNGKPKFCKRLVEVTP